MIGDRIKELREQNNYTQSQLAKELGISRSAVNAWEMGISAPSTQYLVELAQRFRISVDYLLELSDRETLDISDLTAQEKEILYLLLRRFRQGDLPG